MQVLVLKIKLHPEGRKPKTVEKNNILQSFIAKTEGELSFGIYCINFLHKAVRIANS